MPQAPSLDAICAALDLAPHAVQAFDPAHPAFDAQRPLLVLPSQFEAARPELRRRYPASNVARVVRGGGVEECAVAALPFDAEAWLLPALPPEEDLRALAGLRGVMERLFAPDGCPWDREQTHESLRRYLLEETYELVDAIDRGDPDGLREEIGDVLAHIFMQTALAQQAGTFTLEDVLEYATAKFVRRHPHVFGEEEAGTMEALLDRWESIKRAERAASGASEEKPQAGALDSIPLAAPALQRTQSLIGRAGTGGLAPAPVAADEAVRAALETEDVGALLFAAVRLARERGTDAEEALRTAAERFARAFRALEASARASDGDVAQADPAGHAAVWAAAGATPGLAQ
ncbi:MAG: nucleoside triphosphate pyrophosphohydrolase [Dehalococcoidia bacterium]|nr:MAG: nucleoside triphosphate pyrophosphohydrolase [Dehalococcoidia bacterium]